MAVDLAAWCIDAAVPHALAGFWGELLGWTAVDDPMGAALARPHDTGFRLRFRFRRSDRPGTGPDKAHLHLTSAFPEQQAQTVRRVLDLGGQHLDVGQRPEEGHVVLADPEGNAFCVIEAGNSFLAGTGFLGEVARDGSRAVGLFWAAALEWPLVWDRDGETAIQSPAGGTKVSWGGEDPASRTRPSRSHPDLVGDDGEAERLVGLGATPVDSGGCVGAVAMADPDGDPFCLFPR